MVKQPTGDDLVEIALKYDGGPYVLGRKGDPKRGTDCSGLWWWCLRQLGVEFPVGTAATQIDLCIPISIEEANKTPGAMLWYPGHNAIHLGDGRSIEARNPTLGIGINSASFNKNRWKRAGLVPGLDYSKGIKMAVEMPVITTRYGHKTPATKAHRGLDLRSPFGNKVYSIFDGVVVATRKRAKGAPIGRPDKNGVPALAPSVSGGGTKIKLDDGTYYFEVHMSPSVKVGTRVKAFQTLLGTTDESGTIYGTHRHVEMWRRDNANTYFDPTSRIVSAYKKGSSEPEKDWFDMATKKELEEVIKAVMPGLVRSEVQRLLSYQGPNNEAKRDVYTLIKQAANDATAAAKASEKAVEAASSADRGIKNIWDQEVRLTGSTARKLNQPENGTIRSGALLGYAALGEGYTGPTYDQNNA